MIPAHCTGDRATEMLQAMYGKQCTAGAGRWIVLDKDRFDLRMVPKK